MSSMLRVSYCIIIAALRVPILFLPQMGSYLRMTRADCFKDKLEGRIIREYYETALNELRQEGAISSELFGELNQARIPDKDLYITDKQDNIIAASMLLSEVYILCFSTVKCDPNMFKEYGSRGKSKYCLQFFSTMFDELSHYNAKEMTWAKLARVLYGQKVTSYLKKTICSILQMKMSQKSTITLVEDKLHELRYLAKLPEFSKENEVRLIVCLPQDKEVNRKHYLACEDDKAHIWLKLKHYAVSNYWPGPDNLPEDDEALGAILRDRGY